MIIELNNQQTNEIKQEETVIKEPKKKGRPAKVSTPVIPTEVIQPVPEIVQEEPVQETMEEAVKQVPTSSKIVKLPTYNLAQERKNSKNLKNRKLIANVNKINEKQVKEGDQLTKKEIRDLKKIVKLQAEMEKITEDAKRQFDQDLMEHLDKYKLIITTKLLPMLAAEGQDANHPMYNYYKSVADDIDDVINTTFFDKDVELDTWLKEATDEELSNVNIEKIPAGYDADAYIYEEEFLQARLNNDVAIADINKLIAKIEEIQLTEANNPSSIFGGKLKFVTPMSVLSTEAFNHLPIARIKIYKMLCNMIDILSPEKHFLFNQILISAFKVTTDETIKNKLIALNKKYI